MAEQLWPWRLASWRQSAITAQKLTAWSLHIILLLASRCTSPSLGGFVYHQGQWNSRQPSVSNNDWPLFTSSTSKAPVTAQAFQSACPAACQQHGTCNEETGRYAMPATIQGKAVITHGEVIKDCSMSLVYGNSTERQACMLL